MSLYELSDKETRHKNSSLFIVLSNKSKYNVLKNHVQIKEPSSPIRFSEDSFSTWTSPWQSWTTQHCRKKAKERSIKKPHPNCEEATGLGVRGGSVQKHKSECSCWPPVVNLASATAIRSSILGPNPGTTTRWLQSAEEVIETRIVVGHQSFPNPEFLSQPFQAWPWTPVRPRHINWSKRHSARISWARIK